MFNIARNCSSEVFWITPSQLKPAQLTIMSIEWKASSAAFDDLLRKGWLHQVAVDDCDTFGMARRMPASPATPLDPDRTRAHLRPRTPAVARWLCRCLVRLPSRWRFCPLSVNGDSSDVARFSIIYHRCACPKYDATRSALSVSGPRMALLFVNPLPKRNANDAQ